MDLLWDQKLAEERPQEAWEEALRAFVPSPGTQACLRFVFQIASQVPEFYLGGDETAFLVQVLAGPATEQADVDLIATVLAPKEEEACSPETPAAAACPVRYCFTCRGEEALRLCACFMEAHPASPALVSLPDGSFSCVQCCLEDEDPWGRVPVSLEALRAQLRKGGECEKLCFFLPARERRPAARVSLDRFPERPAIALD